MSHTRFNSLFANKFKGCKQIGFKDDPNVEGRRLLVYELPKHLLSEAEQAIELVGINDGSSCWIGSLKSALSNMTKLDPNYRSSVRVKLADSVTKPTVRTRIHVNR